MTTTYAERRALAALASYRALRLDDWAAANGVSYQYAADLFAALEEDNRRAVFLRYVNAIETDRRGRAVLRAVAVYGPRPLADAVARRRASYVQPPPVELSASDAAFLHRSAFADASALLGDYGRPHRTAASDLGTILEAACPQHPRQLLVIGRDRRGLVSVATREHDTRAEHPLALFSDAAIRLWSFGEWSAWLRSLRDELASLTLCAGYSSAA